MSISDHIEYFERRRAESMRLADEAGDDPIGHLYRQFATHYGRVVDQAKAQPRVAIYSEEPSTPGQLRHG